MAGTAPQSKAFDPISLLGDIRDLYRTDTIRTFTAHRLFVDDLDKRSRSF
jgi:hypothetical protein